MSSSGQTQSGLRAGSLGLAGVVVLSAVLMGPAISLFFNTPVMAGNAGASVPLVFVLALVGIMLSASTVAQFARKISSAGSFYGFIERAAGKQFGFMAGWSTFGAYLGAAVGGAAITGAFLSSLLDTHLHIYISWYVLALAIAAVVIAVSITGIKISERVSLVMLSIEALAIAVVVVAIFIKGGANGLTLKPFTFSGAPNGLDGIRLAMVFGVLSFVGFEISASMAEETKAPKRSIPIAVLGCTLVIGLLYVVGSYAVVIGYGVNHVNQLASDPAAFDTLTAKYVTSVSWLVDLILVNALFAATLAVTNTFARIGFALGRDGVIPRWFGSSNARFGTPDRSLIAFGVACVIVIIPLSSKDGLTAYTYISTPASLLLILVFITANLTLGRYYYTSHRREFNVMTHVVLPVIGSLVLLLPISAQFWPTPPSPQNYLPLVTLGWIVIGAAILLWPASRARVLARVGAFAPDEEVEADTPVEQPFVPAGTVAQ